MRKKWDINNKNEQKHIVLYCEVLKFAYLVHLKSKYNKIKKTKVKLGNFVGK